MSTGSGASEVLLLVYALLIFYIKWSVQCLQLFFLEIINKKFENVSIAILPN